jgi:hypothetical protein
MCEPALFDCILAVVYNSKPNISMTAPAAPQPEKDKKSKDKGNSVQANSA